MGNTIQIDIPVTSATEAEIYIADLSDIGFHAFQEGDTILSAFIREEFFNEEFFLPLLSQASYRYTKTIIADINWNQKWESEFTPVNVDSYVAVRASFHSSINTVDHEIIITPKMSFGTGHHPTTYLMLQQMKKINFKNKTVLDFGTGTGILAILACKSGADNITAVDIDDWSIENARENFSINNCTGIHLIKGDSVSGPGRFDVILANINLDVILRNLTSFKELSYSGTELLLSGFLMSDEVIAKAAFENNGFICRETIQKEEWMCMLAEAK